jgi:hypothetical protein
MKGAGGDVVGTKVFWGISVGTWVILRRGGTDVGFGKFSGKTNLHENFSRIFREKNNANFFFRFEKKFQKKIQKKFERKKFPGNVFVNIFQQKFSGNFFEIASLPTPFGGRSAASAGPRWARKLIKKFCFERGSRGSPLGKPPPLGE